jgi:phosphate-selective porin OprO/OprP
MFMERSLSDLFSISRKLGGEIVVSNKLGDYRLNLFGAYFTNSIDERQDGEINKPGLATRITLSNKLAKRNLYSVGIGVKTQDYKGDTIRMKQAAESDLVEDKYVSTKIKEVNSILDTNLEALYIYDKYTLQGEMTHRGVDAQKGNYNFYSYYLQGSYFVLGKGKDFKRSTSTIAGVKPTKDGAVELAVRYSYLNLNDKDEQGGEQQDVTFGVNWYIDDNLRVSGNYIVANPQETDDYDGIFQVLQARILFFF